MKFTKFGKALLLSALSAGVILSVTSCVQSYTVGFLYVTGTVTADSTGNGIITGFKIDHNTGKLTPVNGLPISSGGANPVRAVLVQSSRFLYVLNQGVNKEGGSVCTTADPCLHANITQFSVGANGILSPQETFYTQGLNPFRLIADGTGAHLYVLDHDSPAPGSTASNPIPSSSKNPNKNCSAALGKSVSACGDVTAFSVDTTTGRLSLVINSAATATLGKSLPYFPVPSNAIDFVLSSSTLLTLSGPSTTGGSDSVFPYSYTQATGQLAITSNTAQTLSSIKAATAIVSAGSNIYILDNEPFYPNGSTKATSQSEIWPFTIGNNGTLTAALSNAIADDPNQSNPGYLVAESKGTWFYVANDGNNGTTTSTTETGIAGYVINNPYAPTELSSSVSFTTGGGPRCLVEDPSKQFFYEANHNDSTVTAQALDENAGTLIPLIQATHVASSYTLTGPATWCLTDTRVD
jgi:hypothetical protein